MCVCVLVEQVYEQFTLWIECSILTTEWDLSSMLNLWWELHNGQDEANQRQIRVGYAKQGSVI